MIRLLPLLGSLLLATVSARAEDFSGFYAGVNAGYGWERDHAKGAGRNPGPAAALSNGGAADDGLPPSASAAAAALRRSGQGQPATGR